MSAKTKTLRVDQGCSTLYMWYLGTGGTGPAKKGRNSPVPSFLGGTGGTGDLKSEQILIEGIRSNQTLKSVIFLSGSFVSEISKQPYLSH